MRTYCVIYRTGGTENYKWQRSLAVEDRAKAQILQAVCEKAGYEAMIEDYQLSLSVGLPENY